MRSRPQTIFHHSEKRKLDMKRIVSTAALMLLASATAAYAATPDAVTKAVEACCAIGAACCNGGPCC